MEWTQKYLEVVRALDLDISQEKASSELLDSLLKPQTLEPLKDLIRDRPVMIYGCGPSLENDINKLWDADIHRRFISCAVDGAISALLKYKILPHINVTDLDGDIKSILLANKHGTKTFIHANSQNHHILQKYVPMFQGLTYGTSHTITTDKVHNFGGFTDGDRAIYIMAHFKPRFIALAGMDFGNIIGVHSHKYDPIKKPRSLRMGKMIIEEFAKKTKTRMFNFTSGGEVIQNIESINIDKLKHIT